jgi:hypothetical protein
MIINNNQTQPGLQPAQNMNDSSETIVKIILQYPPEEQNVLIRLVRDGVRRKREEIIAKMEEEINFIKNTIREI